MVGLRDALISIEFVGSATTCVVSPSRQGIGRIPNEYTVFPYQHQLPGGTTGTLKAQLAQ